MKVSEYASDVNLSVAEILKKCHELAINVNNKDELGQKGAVDKSKTTECQTCKNRKYVDGSNEANVSFKNAAHISPG